MIELLPEDVHACVRFMPRELRKLIIDNNLMVAGGYVRAVVAHEDVSDIDIFGPSVTVLKDVAERLADKFKGEVKTSRNAITVLSPGRKPVQFITRWLFTDIEEVIKSFDFTIAQACITAAPDASVEDDASYNWKGICSSRFYADLAGKRLTYTRPKRNEDAGGSMLRVTKFLGRGYHISPGSLGMVMARIADRVRWESSMVSDELGKAKVITGLLRQVDPLLAIDGCELAEEETVKVSDIQEALHPARWADDESIEDKEG